MDNQKYLDELQEKSTAVQNQINEVQQNLNNLIVVKTKLDGAIEHQQYVIEQTKEKNKDKSKKPK
jgi:hypothetical protein